MPDWQLRDARTVKVTVMHGSDKLALDVYPDEPAELLQCQLWSATRVPPEEQMLTGLVSGIVAPDSSLANVEEGTWCMLQRRTVLNVAGLSLAPSGEAARWASSPTQEHRARERMRNTLRSGFETSRHHADEAQLTAARETVPWTELRVRAVEDRAQHERLRAAERFRVARLEREGRALALLPRGARVDAVRFVPVALRDWAAPCVQLAQLRLYDGEDRPIPLADASCPGGRSPEGEEPARLLDGTDGTRWLDWERQPVEARVAQGGAVVARCARRRRTGAWRHAGRRVQGVASVAFRHWRRVRGVASGASHQGRYVSGIA